MTKPLLSVVLSVYNAAPYLEECLAALAKQTYEPIEFWLADDGSSDDSRAILDQWAAKDSRFKTDHNDKNIGKIKTINRLLLDRAKGKYLSVHDADDYSAPNRFELQLQFLEAEPDYGLCGTFYTKISDDNKVLRKEKKHVSADAIRAELKNFNQFCGPTMVYRANLFKRLGGYRPFLNRIGNEDYDLSYRAAEQMKCSNIPHFLYYYRQSENSLSKTLKAENAVSHKLVQWLALERAAEGKDALQKNEVERCVAQLEKLCQPYKEKPDLLCREYAAGYMYEKLYRSAFFAALQAIKINPKKLINYRTAFYILRKANFNLLN